MLALGATVIGATVAGVYFYGPIGGLAAVILGGLALGERYREEHPSPEPPPDRD
jgi:hypothetical protein